MKPSSALHIWINHSHQSILPYCLPWLILTFHVHTHSDCGTLQTCSANSTKLCVRGFSTVVNKEKKGFIVTAGAQGVLYDDAFTPPG